MSSAAPKSNQKASLPEGLQDLLVREASFALSRRRISDALAVAEKQKTAVASARPLLSFIFRDTKKDHKAKRQEMMENVSVLGAGVLKLDAVIPILQTCVERSLENYLREFDPEYANGLAASRFVDDWQRLLVRFDQAVSLFVGAVAKLPGLLEAVAASATCGSNLECRKTIDAAVSAARVLQDEVTFLNKIADSQRIRSGIGAITLYRQPERNWKGAVHSLLFTQPAPAAQAIGSVLVEANEVVEKIRGAIQGECQLASYVVGYGVTSYHQRVWASLRESATLRIDPDQLESILSDTEERMDRGILEPWTVPHAELPPEVVIAVPAPAPVRSPAPESSGASAPTVVAAPPSVSIPANKSPQLKLPSRSSPCAADAVAPAIIAVAAAASDAASTPTVAEEKSTKEAADTVADLTAERLRLEEILRETRDGFEQREVFLSQSEERLLQKSQAQLEREVELEQREEQLLDLEKRLREKLGAAMPGPEPVAKKPYDEFSE